MLTELTKYRSVFISDLHLGTKMSQVSQLLEFLKLVDCDKLYLVGDIIDTWGMNKSIYWPQSHNDVVQKILRKARKGTEVIYLPGNHDDCMRKFGDQIFGNIQMVDTIIHTSVDGKTYVVLHGDQFDSVIANANWLAHLGSWAYDMLIVLNIAVARIRKRMGLPYWSVSAWAKYKVKQAVNFIGNFEEQLTIYAKSKGANGIICGHIHHANIRDINGMTYINCGDWVESCTAIVEHIDGTWELINWKQ